MIKLRDTRDKRHGLDVCRLSRKDLLAHREFAIDVFEKQKKNTGRYEIPPYVHNDGFAVFPISWNNRESHGIRLHVFSRRLFSKASESFHDHPWNLRSFVLCGNIDMELLASSNAEVFRRYKCSWHPGKEEYLFTEGGYVRGKSSDVIGIEEGHVYALDAACAHRLMAPEVTTVTLAQRSPHLRDWSNMYYKDKQMSTSHRVIKKLLTAEELEFVLETALSALY